MAIPTCLTLLCSRFIEWVHRSIQTRGFSDRDSIDLKKLTYKCVRPYMHVIFFVHQVMAWDCSHPPASSLIAPDSSLVHLRICPLSARLEVSIRNHHHVLFVAAEKEHFLRHTSVELQMKYTHT